MSKKNKNTKTTNADKTTDAAIGTAETKKIVEYIKHEEVIKQEVVVHDIWQPLNPNKQLPDLNELLLSSDGILKDKISNLIIDAKETIFICSFLINDNDMVNHLIEKASKGVNIYILTASEAVINKSNNEDYTRHDEHVALLKKLSSEYRILVRTGNIHAKFIIIDAHKASIKGLLSTSNFNKEPLSRDGEVGIMLDKSRATNLANLFIKTFWEKSENELATDGKSLNNIIQKETTIELDDSNILFTFDDEYNSIKENVIKYIANAQKRIYITSFNYDYKDIEAVLLDKARHGLDIQIVGRQRKILNSNLYKILKDYENVMFYVHEAIHAKLLICDNSALLLTANFEAKGIDTGVEAGVEINSLEAKKVFNFYKNLAIFCHFAAKKYKAESDDILWESGTDKIEGNRINITNKIVNAGKTKTDIKPDFEKIRKDNPYSPEIKVTWEEEIVKEIIVDKEAKKEVKNRK